MTGIPFHITLVMNNKAGYLFVNRDTGLAVQRWTALDQFSDAVTLLDCMFDDLAFSTADAVLLDMRLLEANVSEIYCMALVRYCVACHSIRRLALVGNSANWSSSQGLAEIQAYARSQDVELIFSEKLDEAATLLAARAGDLLPAAQPVDFVGSYGGSVYSWPEHSAVVLTLSGNDGDYASTQEALQTGLLYCREKSAKAFILDSTASAPVSDGYGLQFVQENLLKPLLASGLTEFIHVRTYGDKALCGPAALEVAELLKQAGIRYVRVGTITEAMLFLDTLQAPVLAPHTTSWH